MSWLVLIRSLLAGLAGLTKWLADRQLLEAGKAQALVESLKKDQERVQKAIEARRKAAIAPLDADADGVPDDDGYRRD